MQNKAERYVIKNKYYRIAGITFIVTTAIYLFWLSSHLNSEAKLIGYTFFFCQAFSFLLVNLSIINHWKIKYRLKRPPLPENHPAVAIVVPTYKEPVNIIRKTVISPLGLSYPGETVIVVSNDDSDPRQKSDLEIMLKEFSSDRLFLIHTNPHKEAKAGNLNQALSFLIKHFPDTDFLLTQDADEIADRDILNATVGYFTNPNIAYVQTIKQAKVTKDDPFGNRDMMWYGRTAASKDADNAMFACGSGVVWRISALESVGGFSTWNMVEDLTTSYNLLAKGWDSRYHFEPLSEGLAPEDLPNFIKQRVTWATDALRIFFWDNPLFKKGLTFNQKLQFLETPLFYLNGFAVLTLVALTSLSLFLGKWPTSVDAITHTKYLLPSFLSLEIYFLLNNGNIPYTRIRQFWVGLSPNFASAAIKVILSGPNKKPTYKVTRKVNKYGNYLHIVLPQIFVLSLISLSLVKVVVSTPLYSGFDWATVFWGFYQASFFIQVIRVSWWKYSPRVSIKLSTNGAIRNSHGTVYPSSPSLSIKTSEVLES